MIEVARPWMFALLLALPLLWLGMRGSIAGWTAAQRRVCTAMRILLLAAVVVARAIFFVAGSREYERISSPDTNPAFAAGDFGRTSRTIT